MGNEVDSAMSGQPYPLQRPVNPGEEVEVEIDLTAPQDAGEYQALWQLTDKTGEAFGELLPLVVRVVVAPP
jgi:hypothetical protein